MVSGNGERCEVMILCDDEIRARSNRTISENVVIRVVTDDLEMKLGSDP